MPLISPSHGFLPLVRELIYLIWIYSNRRKSTLDFCLLLGYRKMKRTCSHLSTRNSWINDKIITFPEPRAKDTRQLDSLKPMERQTPSGRKDAWNGSSMVEQSRKRRQSQLHPHRRRECLHLGTNITYSSLYYST